jgi:NTP pyrophosphatase (non-canonical NTP hydrolase)
VNGYGPDEFQAQMLAVHRQEAPYTEPIRDLEWTALGAAGERCEVQEEVKRIGRDDGGRLTVERRARIISELGDLQVYVANMAALVECPLSELMWEAAGKAFEWAEGRAAARRDSSSR